MRIVKEFAGNYYIRVKAVGAQGSQSPSGFSSYGSRGEYNLYFDELFIVGDQDEDGVLDGWEQQYFGTLSYTSSDDPDGDGFSNLDEFIAGSLVRRLGVEEGQLLNPPVFEFFLKNDALHDPMVNDYHIESFGWATAAQVARMKELTFAVNDVLKALFDQGGMILVDYKLEFGVDSAGNIVLGDEFTPDGCRLWDKETRKKMDKDRFRQGLGSVVETYIEVAERLGLKL